VPHGQDLAVTPYGMENGMEGSGRFKPVPLLGSGQAHARGVDIADMTLT